MKHHGHPRFKAILKELGELHDRKNYQYASSSDPLGNFRRVGSLISKLLKPGIDPTLAACVILMAKQVDGIYEIIGENKKGTTDSLEDKLKDISVYSVIAQIILENSA